MASHGQRQSEAERGSVAGQEQAVDSGCLKGSCGVLRTVLLGRDDPTELADDVMRRALPAHLAIWHAGAALDLLNVMDDLLMEKLQESMAADPPTPLHEQITTRNENFGAMRND